MRRTLGPLVLVLLVVVCSGCDWTQLGGGAGHTNSTWDDVIAPTSVGALTASSFSPIVASSAVVTYKGLAFLQQDGSLTALDAKTSGVVWKATLPAGSTLGSVPAVDPTSNTVFVVVARAESPILLGFDVNGVGNCNRLANTCTPTFAGVIGSSPGAATAPANYGGKIYVNGPGALYAFDAAGQVNCTPYQGLQACAPLWASATGMPAPTLGPAVGSGIVYDAVASSGQAGLGAFDGQTGQELWSGSVGSASTTASPSVASNGTVFVPAGNVIDVFVGTGCGAATCAPAFALSSVVGDPAGQFLATPAVDGGTIIATNANGHAYSWPQIGCGAPTCVPQTSVVVNAPGGASSGYAQSPVVTNGLVFLLGKHVVGGTDRMRVVALAENNLANVTTWDIGSAGFAPGLASVSIAQGVVYAPTTAGVFEVFPGAPQPLASLSISPLALQPAFAPSTNDYVIACAAGTNSITLDASSVAGGSVQLLTPIATAPAATQHADLQLVENQPVVLQATDTRGAVAQYWIRCLPHDFPLVTATAHPQNGAPTPGWYLTGNLALGGTKGSFAMIVNANGTPVWYRRTNGAIEVTALAPNTVAYMSLATQAGFGIDPNGAFDVINLATGQTSRIGTVGVPTDLHELYTLPSGNHVLLSYPLKTGVDLTGLAGAPTPGPNSTIADCEIQEVNPQGQLVWKWDASDHIDPVTEPVVAPAVTVSGQTVYDVFHCNSVDVNPSGDLLVSARNLSAVFEVRRSDGKIIWKMGGTATSKDGAAIVQIQNYDLTTISAQHDARWLENGDISLFDDQSYRTGPAAGVEFSVNVAAGTATPTFEFKAPSGLKSVATGSFRRYSDGESVVGWGLTPTQDGSLLTELTATGSDVLDLSFPQGSAAYRAVKVPTYEFDANVLRFTAGS
jgi:hypothetical protein